MYLHTAQGPYVWAGWHPGLGSATQIVGTAGSVASPVVTAAAAPATAAALGISASLAVPLVGAAFAGVLIGIEALLNSGCGQACVVTSEWANQAEPLLRRNIDTYFNLPVRTESDRQSALRMYDAIWQGLVERCSQPGLSTAGRNCIADRQAGACKWHQTGESPWPGGPALGECWNWDAAYRAPIANDRDVVPDAQAAAEAAASDFASAFNVSGGAGGASLLPLAAIAGLVLLGVLS